MARAAVRKSKGASQGQLRLEAARAAAEVAAQRVGVAPAQIEHQAAPPPPPMPIARAAAPAEAFGAWLLRQKGSGREYLDQLARAAAADRGFPRHGNPDEIYGYIEAKGADGDFLAAIEDAEAIWARG